jgi:galactokinase/mevalonate kinase-like predicted kinase
MIERSAAFAGSLRPEEIRDQRKKSLEAEKKNLESLLTQIQTTRTSLEENVYKADFLVEKVRLKLDKDIDQRWRRKRKISKNESGFLYRAPFCQRRND